MLKVRIIAETVTVSGLIADGLFVGISGSRNCKSYINTGPYGVIGMTALGTIPFRAAGAERNAKPARGG